MSYRKLDSAWNNPWPECVPDRDLDRFEADSGSARHSQDIVDDSTIIDDIVTIGRNIGLVVDADDMEELLELTTEELEHLQDVHGKNWLKKLKKKNGIKKMSHVL